MGQELDIFETTRERITAWRKANHMNVEKVPQESMSDLAGLGINLSKSGQIFLGSKSVFARKLGKHFISEQIDGIYTTGQYVRGYFKVLDCKYPGMFKGWHRDRLGVRGPGYFYNPQGQAGIWQQLVYLDFRACYWNILKYAGPDFRWSEMCYGTTGTHFDMMDQVDTQPSSLKQQIYGNMCRRGGPFLMNGVPGAKLLLNPFYLPQTVRYLMDTLDTIMHELQQLGAFMSVVDAVMIRPELERDALRIAERWGMTFQVKHRGEAVFWNHGDYQFGREYAYRRDEIDHHWTHNALHVRSPHLNPVNTLHVLSPARRTALYDIRQRLLGGLDIPCTPTPA